MTDLPHIDGSKIEEAVNRSLRSILVDDIEIERYNNDADFHYFINHIILLTVFTTVDVIKGKPRRKGIEEQQQRIALPLIGRDEIIEILAHE